MVTPVFERMRNIMKQDFIPPLMQRIAGSISVDIAFKRFRSIFFINLRLAVANTNASDSYKFIVIGKCIDRGDRGRFKEG